VQKAYLAVLPDAPPGLTPAELQKRLAPLLPQDLFPRGAKAGWWMKAVQLDAEAKGLARRSERPPVRLWKA